MAGSSLRVQANIINKGMSSMVINVGIDGVPFDIDGTVPYDLPQFEGYTCDKTTVNLVLDADSIWNNNADMPTYTASATYTGAPILPLEDSSGGKGIQMQDFYSDALIDFSFISNNNAGIKYYWEDTNKSNKYKIKIYIAKKDEKLEIELPNDFAKSYGYHFSTNKLTNEAYKYNPNSDEYRLRFYKNDTDIIIANRGVGLAGGPQDWIDPSESGWELRQEYGDNPGATENDFLSIVANDVEFPVYDNFKASAAVFDSNAATDPNVNPEAPIYSSDNDFFTVPFLMPGKSTTIYCMDNKSIYNESVYMGEATADEPSKEAFYYHDSTGSKEWIIGKTLDGNFWFSKSKLNHGGEGTPQKIRHQDPTFYYNSSNAIDNTDPNWLLLTTIPLHAKLNDGSSATVYYFAAGKLGSEITISGQPDLGFDYTLVDALPRTFTITSESSPHWGAVTEKQESNVVPYPGAIGLGDLVILSANPKLNKYVNGRLDPIGRVFDNLGLKVISDIVDGNGRREVVVTTSRGDYHPTPYDVLVRNTSVHWSADNVPESGYMITSSMNPFAPYQGYFHQDFPLFLESYDGDKYKFVNLFGLKIENLRSKDETGNNTYNWIKSVYDDFLKYHSFMLCYYLGFTNHGHNYMSFYKYDPSDGIDWGGENITQDSASVVDVSSVITSSITAKAHGSYIKEGFMVDDKGNPYYYGVVYYDYMRTSDPNDGNDFEKRVVANINLKNEHVVQMSTTGRNYSDNPRIVRLYRQDANNSDNLTLLGFYAIDENAHVKQITDMTDINAPQYSIKDIIIDSNTTIDSAVFQNVKYILTERDLDISVVLDMANRYSASMLACFMDDKSNLTPFFHTYDGWVKAYFDDKPDSLPVLLQFQQIDFVAQTLLLATNNDIVLKERVR